MSEFISCKTNNFFNEMVFNSILWGGLFKDLKLFAFLKFRHPVWWFCTLVNSGLKICQTWNMREKRFLIFYYLPIKKLFCQQ